MEQDCTALVLFKYNNYEHVTGWAKSRVLFPTFWYTLYVTVWIYLFVSPSMRYIMRGHGFREGRTGRQSLGKSWLPDQPHPYAKWCPRLLGVTVVSLSLGYIVGKLHCGGGPCYSLDYNGLDIHSRGHTRQETIHESHCNAKRDKLHMIQLY